MIVCVCHRVSDRDIAIAASSGCPNFDALQDDLRVATACGACHDCAREVFEESRVAACPGHGRGARTIAIQALAA